MKPCTPLFIALIIYGVCIKTNAQQKDTAASANNLNQIIKKMHDDKKDSWNMLSRSRKIDLFIRYKYLNNIHPKTSAQFSFYGLGVMVRLNQVQTIEIAAASITPKMANKYIYHVVANDSVELVPWTHPSVFRANKFIPYAYLGSFDCQKRIIKIEMYEVGNYLNKSVTIINGGYMPAAEAEAVTVKYNDKNLFNPDKQEYIPNSKQHTYKNWNKEPIQIKWSDSVNHIAVQIKPTLQNDIYHVYLKRTIDNYTDTVLVTNAWTQTYYWPSPVAQINSAWFNKPGDYQIIIRPEMPTGFKNEHGPSTIISFKVLPIPLTVSVSTFAWVIFIISITVAYMFREYRACLGRRLVREAHKKQVATLQLQSVRAQLNPHFVFNALAGIQNLMNKQQTENANRYLSRFARLTRNILEESSQELITIEREVDLLNDYLQMEQLRFGFSYKINVDGSIDQQIQIPAMLLQPFAENAVKHGVSAMGVDGLVTINIIKMNNDLMLRVEDNGKGVYVSNTSGIGMKLSSERIRLLNNFYKNSIILLPVESDTAGTCVTIQLQNWL